VIEVPERGFFSNERKNKMLSEQKKKRMLARALRLAAKYGPFVRFFPDGNEGNVDPAKPDDEAAKAAKAEEQRKIDLERANEQQLEQEKANTARANETARQTQESLETAQAETESLKEQLDKAEAKAAQAGIQDVELDESAYEGTDLNLVRAIKTLEKKIDAKDQKIEGLEKKADGYEKRNRENQAQSVRNSKYEELLTGLDGDYGADCRNDAVKKFNEMIDKGDVPKGNLIKATRAMEKCYKEVNAAKAKGSKENKSSLTLDSGSGGGSPPSLSGAQIPDGLSLEDAVKHLAAASKK
jgi:DNA repair exonuclease SbcCD ATPase subunit